MPLRPGTPARTLGLVSLALGVPAVAAPEAVSRLVADDSATAPRVVSAVGYREPVQDSCTRVVRRP